MEEGGGAARSVCPQCGRSRGLGYCPDCLVVLEDGAPSLQLPVKIDIVLHAETNARSTALAAALLAPAHVAVHRHAGTTTGRRCDPLALQLPVFDAATTVVLFPEGPDTPAIGGPGCPPFQRVVVLESSWKKARGLLRHPRLAGLRRVQLPAQACGGSEFSWRRGDGGFRGAVESGLSSIEAIQRCCRLLHPGESYDGLLHWFRRTKQRVDARGPLPTSRQEARSQQRQQRQREEQQQQQLGQRQLGQQQLELQGEQQIQLEQGDLEQQQQRWAQQHQESSLPA